MDAEPAEESDDESDDAGDGKETRLLPREAGELCQEMEALCMAYSEAEGLSLLAFQQQLRKLRGYFRQLEFRGQKQTTLDAFWGGEKTKDVEMREC